MQRILTLLIFFTSFTAALFGQPSFTVSPSQISTRPYNGILTATGTNTTFTNATAGINLRLTHAASGTVFSIGNTPQSAPWATYPPSSQTLTSGNISLPSNAPIGLYDVSLIGIENIGFYNAFIYSGFGIFEILSNSAYFEGSVVVDSDSNCVRSAGDLGYPGLVVTALPGPFYGYPDNNGNFAMNIPVGTYTFSISTPGVTVLCPASPFSQIATVASEGDTTRGIDFYVKSTPLPDLAVNVVALAHRPGFSNNIVFVNVENLRSSAAANVVLKIIKPSIFSYTSFNPINPTTTVGDTAIFNLGTLGPFATQSIMLNDLVPAIGTFGNTYQYFASVTTTSPEFVSANNNEDSAAFVVTGSFDPNDKQVWNARGENADGFIETTDVKLRYLIRFQNTGTDTAFNIHIADTIDPRLDLGSLRILSASHPVDLRSDLTMNNALTFYFDNVLLPDSNRNEPLSHGYVEYTIDRISSLVIGDSIQNTASIYFDFNAAVVTNTVSSKICPKIDSTFTIGINNMDANFQASAIGGANSWDWDFGDGQTGTGINPSHTYSANGIYNVCLTIRNACGRVHTSCGNAYIGMTTIAEISDIKAQLIPNPANNLVKLSVEGKALKGINVTLNDALGRQIGQWQQTGSSSKFEQTIDLREIPEGIYFLNIATRNHQKTMRLVVKH